MSREPGKLSRSMHIDNREWQYEPGRMCTKIRHPLGETRVIDNHMILGITRSDFQNRIAEGEKFAITPGLVKGYALKFF